MRYPRTLVLAVMFKPTLMPKLQQLRHMEADTQDSDEETLASGVTLASCFAGYQNLDTLTGDNQYYCRACKEHTDSTKKLEIY